MSKFTHHDLEQVQSILFSKDKLRSWEKLSELLTLQLESVKNEADPFSSWWNSNFALFSSVQVQISTVNAGSSSFEDEYIEISNYGPAIVDLSGDIWREMFYFPLELIFLVTMCCVQKLFPLMQLLVREFALLV